ncbi:hypothetical protein HK102_000956, partial [Quaeritorhiza haematococci]
MSKPIYLRTELTDILGIIYPIICPPMAGVTGGKLAGAVSKAGGLGIIGTGYTSDPKWLRDQMDIARSMTLNPVGIGFITWTLAENENTRLLETALDLQPAVIWFSFGDFSPYVELVRSHPKTRDTKIIAQINTVDEAIQAVGFGADIIVAQGSEAGGHGAKDNASVFCLVPEVVDAVGDKVPVVAAGGVTDGRQMA